MWSRLRKNEAVVIQVSEWILWWGWGERRIELEKRMRILSELIEMLYILFWGGGHMGVYDCETN